MAGAIKTLFQMLSASAYMTGNNVSIVYGEEEQFDQSQPLPRVVIIPRGGNWDTVSGYAKNTDPNIEMTWGCRETIDIECWAWSNLPNAQPVDHADAVETLIGLVLSAFQDQRMNQAYDANSGGLYYQPVSGQWITAQGASIRYGRAYRLTVFVDKTIDMTPPPEVTNPHFTLTATINV